MINRAKIQKELNNLAKYIKKIERERNGRSFAEYELEIRDAYAMKVEVNKLAGIKLYNV
jgi:hypothetical protein